ncbi:MAG: hypothetical protein WCD51_13225 [Anaerolineae bacterium]
MPSGTEFHVPRLSVPLQAWAWYSLDDEYFEGYESYSHLFDPDTKGITTLGIAYGDYTASVP